MFILRIKDIPKLDLHLPQIRGLHHWVHYVKSSRQRCPSQTTGSFFRYLIIKSIRIGPTFELKFDIYHQTNVINYSKLIVNIDSST